MTRKDYDVTHLINIIKGLHQRYPWLKIILEPGSAFAWQTGPLVSQVIDVVDATMQSAIVNNLSGLIEVDVWMALQLVQRQAIDVKLSEHRVVRDYEEGDGRLREILYLKQLLNTAIAA